MNVLCMGCQILYVGCCILCVGCWILYADYFVLCVICCSTYVAYCILHVGCCSSMWAVTASMHAAQALCGMLKTEKNNKSSDSATVQAFQFEAKNWKKEIKKFTGFPKHDRKFGETELLSDNPYSVRRNTEVSVNNLCGSEGANTLSTLGHIFGFGHISGFLHLRRKSACPCSRQNTKHRKIINYTPCSWLRKSVDKKWSARFAEF